MSMSRVFRVLAARYKLVALIFLMVVITTAVVSKLSPKLYTASSTLIVDFGGMDPVTGAVFNSQQLLPTYMATQVDVIGSHKVAIRVVETLKMTEDPVAQEDFAGTNRAQGTFKDWLADQLLENLEVAPSRQSNIIEVSYTAEEPAEAAKIANAFTQAYIDTNLELRTGPARQTASWFEDQVQGLRDDLANAQARLSAAQQEKGIVSLGDERLDLEKSRLAQYGSELVVAQSHTAEAMSRLKHLEEARAQGKSPDSMPEVLENDLVSKLKEYLNTAEGKLADTAQRVGVQHPSYVRAQAEVANLKAKLKVEIEHVVNGVVAQARIAERREAELKAALAAEKSKVLDLAYQRDEVAVLIREVENAQRAYDAAMKRFSETRLESEASQTNVAVLNSAVIPAKPSHPKLKMNIALAVLFGGALAVGSALAAEMMDRRVRDAEDLELALDLPVLGVLAGPPKITALPSAREASTKSLPWLSSG